MAEALGGAAGLPPLSAPGQQPQARRGLLPRPRRSPTSAARAADRRQARQDRPGRASPQLLGRRGRARPRRRPRRAWRWPRSARPTRRSSTGSGRSASSDPLLDEGLDELAASSRPRARARARRRSWPTCGSPAASTTTPARSTRPSWSGYESLGSICSGGRYDALASDGRTTYPGVGHLDRRHPAARAAARRRGLLDRAAVGADRACSSRCPTRSAAPSCDRSPRALRARGIAAEVAPAAAKYGKQIRYAERRGIPFVWFPGDDEGGDEVQGHPLAASRCPPTPPRGRPPPRICTPASSPVGHRPPSEGTGHSVSRGPCQLPVASRTGPSSTGCGVGGGTVTCSVVEPALRLPKAMPPTTT